MMMCILSHSFPQEWAGSAKLDFFFLVDQILYMFRENQDYHFCFTSAAPPDGDKWQNEMLDTGCEGLPCHTKKEQC